jgi:hypothetical protein
MPTTDSPYYSREFKLSAVRRMVEGVNVMNGEALYRIHFTTTRYPLFSNAIPLRRESSRRP